MITLVLTPALIPIFKLGNEESTRNTELNLALRGVYVNITQRAYFCVSIIG